MDRRIKIAIDAMGGDSAPEMVVDGLAVAKQQLPHVDFLVFGDETKVGELINANRALAQVCEIRHAIDKVENGDRVAHALRKRRQSSMRLAIDAVKEGEAQGVVSAGNTGALMAMAKMVLKTMPGIDRPAMATVFPNQRGSTVMLDLGANVECDANNLVQFAVMGEVFARRVLDLPNPSVGILNVGEEDVKGHEGVREAAHILQQSPLPIHFYGFVEGTDIGAGTVDVIVTDGFTGNIALKTIEGTARFVGYFLKRALTSSPRAKLGAWLAKPALRQFKHSVDPRRYNGAMFLGLNGICVKSHGGTDKLGFSNAVRVAADLIEKEVNERIREDLNQLNEISAVNEAAEG